MKRCLLILIGIGWIFQPVVALDNQASGLLFRSNDELIDHRTSLDLFNGKFIKFKNRFSIDFDISVKDIKKFGYVLRIVDEQGKAINLIFVNFRGENNLYFDFNYDETATGSVQIPVKKEDLSQGKWIHIAMDFDLKNDSAFVSIAGKQYPAGALGLPREAKFKFIFGLYGINLDVPEMAIRHIQIKHQGKLRYVFPLNESAGEIVHDENGRALGKVKNPIWLINRHHNWQAAQTFLADCTAGIAYNEQNHELIVINKDSLTLYDTQKKQFICRRLNRSLFTINSGEAIYSAKNQLCYVYNLNEADTTLPSLAVIDGKNWEVKQIGRPVLRNRLHHHNVFLNENEDSLYIFGGYGNFSYSNAIYQYNQVDRWQKMDVSGDTVYPRFFAAMGPANRPSEYLIFGGFGNKSGKQEMGGKNLYDLFRLDLNTKTMQQLWQNGAIPELFVPCGNLIPTDDNAAFYTLCYPHHLSKTELHLYKFDMQTGAYEIVSNAIPLLSEKINTRVYLFYDRILNLFFAVVREYVNEKQSEIRVYSLLNPPVTFSELEQEYSGNQWLIILIALVSGLLLLSAFLIFAKKKQKEFPIHTENDQPVIETGKRTNAVFVYGDFCVYDKNGADISYRFSNKLRQIFALVLCNSVGENPGVSTEKLSSELWPDKELAETKNIRNVTINHLRNVLSDLDGISLVYQNAKWLFELKDIFYCDYLGYDYIIKQSSFETIVVGDTLDHLSRIFRRGLLFPSIQTSWMDHYKQLSEEILTTKFNAFLPELYAADDLDRTGKIAEILLSVDPMDETALEYGIKALKKSGKQKQAQRLYNRFCGNYKKLIGVEYKKSYAYFV